MGRAEVGEGRGWCGSERREIGRGVCEGGVTGARRVCRGEGREVREVCEAVGGGRGVWGGGYVKLKVEWPHGLGLFHSPLMAAWS